MTDDEITVYSDYVCPFCYLGKRSLETYRERSERDVAVDWHPFDLRRHKRGPDGEIDDSVEDGKDEEYFEQAKRNVERLREEYGADAMLDVDAVPEIDSLDAQVASVYVQREHPDAWPAFDETVFEGYWEEGRDIEDPDVLADIAESAGLDGGEIRSAITDEDRRDRLRELFAAAHEQGVTGVPTFASEGYAARGAVPPEQLERLVEGN